MTKLIVTANGYRCAPVEVKKEAPKPVMPVIPVKVIGRYKTQFQKEFFANMKRQAV